MNWSSQMEESTGASSRIIKSMDRACTSGPSVSLIKVNGKRTRRMGMGCSSGSMALANTLEDSKMMSAMATDSTSGTSETNHIAATGSKARRMESAM